MEQDKNTGKRKADMREVRRIANDICKILSSQGFNIVRYDPPFSSYIKVDGGLCHSIRISGHTSSKEHLSYRYNVLVCGLEKDCYKVDKRGYISYFARKESVGKIIDLIKKNREETIDKYGKENYYSYVLRNLEDNKNNEKGFWSKAKSLKSTNKNKFEYYDGIDTRSLTKKVRKLIKQREERRIYNSRSYSNK